MMGQKKFSHCNPFLPVRSLRATLDYYREKLGFYEEWTFGDHDGGIRRDDMRLIFGENPVFTASINSPDNRLAIMWFAQNIEDIFVEFHSKGIQIESPPRVHPYGLKEFSFIDINGYCIRVAEGVKET